MNNITIFNNSEFGNLRGLEINNEPWFVGKDVAEALGYSNHRKALIDHVDDDDKTDGVTIRDSIGRNQQPVLINESGLYSLILSSKLPSAKKFKRWVTSEVLPSLRKTGNYSLTTRNYSDLSTNTQTLYLMLDSIAENERRVKQLEGDVGLIKTDVETARENLKTAASAIKLESNWRSDLKNTINQIVRAKGTTWEIEWPLLYRELEERARCNLTARKNNRIRRMMQAGIPKGTINKIRKIDVVEADPKLKEIFSKIVAESIILYCMK